MASIRGATVAIDGPTAVSTNMGLSPVAPPAPPAIPALPIAAHFATPPITTALRNAALLDRA